MILRFMTYNKRLFTILSAAVVMSIGYTNCSDFASVQRASDNGTLGSIQGRTVQECDAALLDVYEKSLYPWFRNNSTCMSCHIEGGTGIGVFASATVFNSFTAFKAAGISKVEYMATNPNHKAPYTGLQNKPAMDQMAPNWTRAEKDHLACVSQAENGGNSSVLTSPKKAPSIYSAVNSVQTLTWELDLASDLDDSTPKPIPVKVSIDVKVLYHAVGGQQLAKGYIFSNPMASMKDSTKQVVMEGLFFQINRRPISSQTTYTSLSRVVSGTTPIPLMKASANTLIEPISTEDEFQLYFRRLVLTEEGANADAPATPILAVTDRSTGVNTHLRERTASIFILRDSGISRWCLSESPTPPASTEAACVNSEAGANVVNGWYLNRPTSFTFSNGDGQKRLYLWVANDSLKMNATPAKIAIADNGTLRDYITLDTMAPAAPNLTSINVTDTQVADLVTTHAQESDVHSWCVFEQSELVGTTPDFGQGRSKPPLDHQCWRWTDNGEKPTTVGFMAGGNRNVFVFVRDIAGNVSAASNMRTAMNPHGVITYTKLTDLSQPLKPTAIFANRCFACHGSTNNPGYNRLPLFTTYNAQGQVAVDGYSATLEVVRNGQLISRINNEISPMPNVAGGLMPKRDRDLIRLWSLTRDGANQPLP